jgi:hypothetical protein
MVDKFPFINRKHILSFLQSVPFQKTSDSEAYKEAFCSKFFQIFKDRYNGAIVFVQFKCYETNKFRELILLSVLSSEFDTFSSEKNQKNNGINDEIFALLNNEIIKSVIDIEGNPGFADLDEYNDDADKFSKIPFTKIDTRKFYRELAKLALEGSIYVPWRYSTWKTQRMTAKFVTSITGGRYNDFIIYKTNDCWSGYILGFFVAYFIFDKGKGEFWILSKDDFD